MIYAIQAGDGGPVKFGVAINPENRLRELQTGNPARLRLLASVEIDKSNERRIHQYLRDYRLQGEWFKPDPKVLQVVEDLRCRAELGGLYGNDFAMMGYFERVGRERLYLLMYDPNKELEHGCN